MRTLRRLGLLAALWGLAWGALQVHARLLDAVPPMSIPLARAVKRVATGFDNVVADGYFLAFIHHFGGSLRERRKVRQAAPVLELITDLDPHFEGAYVLGTLALGDAGQLEAADALWHKAVAANNRRWQLPYQAGMTMFLFGDQPDQYLRAARWFGRAASLPGAPPEARFMEGRMYQVTERRALAIALWRDIYLHDPRPTSRDVAARTLQAWGVPLPKTPRQR
ncbi:MAG: hypothetical protein VKP62_06890 [Candidatus Sericytochromatia bacterium]|nr:hypothetical protein [Candidatus Sericytochromatia bacterium]